MRISSEKRFSQEISHLWAHHSRDQTCLRADAIKGARPALESIDPIDEGLILELFPHPLIYPSANLYLCIEHATFRNANYQVETAKCKKKRKLKYRIIKS